MGCDIHLFIEKYNEESKRWESLNLYRKNPDDTYEPIPVYNGRDYELFGLLAGVRGSSHFFGSDYGYLAEPRGLPEDMSVQAQLEWENGKDEDGKMWWHTPTWYDFCELDTYAYLLNDFNKEMKKKNKKIEELEKKIKELESKEDDDDCCDWSPWYFNCDEEEDDDCDGIDSLVGFVKCIEDILHAYGRWRIHYGEVRVVMWFDN